MVTKMRNIDAVIDGDLEEIFSLLRPNFLAVDGEGYAFHKYMF